MDNYISQQGGWYYSPLNRWIMAGPVIPLNKLRVVDPCWAEGLCNGSGTTTSDPAPPTTTPPTSTPPVSTPPSTPVSTAPPATTVPVFPTAAPTPVANAPVTKPAPVTSPPAKHSPKKKQPKTKRHSNIAHTASVSARSCKAAKTSHTKKGAKRAAYVVGRRGRAPPRPPALTSRRPGHPAGAGHPPASPGTGPGPATPDRRSSGHRTHR